MKISYFTVFFIMQTISARRCRQRLRKPPKLVVIQNTATPDLPVECARSDPLLLPPIHTQPSNCYRKLQQMELLPFYQNESPSFSVCNSRLPQNLFDFTNFDCKKFPEFNQNILTYQAELPNFLDCKSLLPKHRTEFPDCGCKQWPKMKNDVQNTIEFNGREDDFFCPRLNGRESCQQNEQLILPPTQVELFDGLGYFLSAVPYVASCFGPAVEMEGICSGANIPITSPYGCLTLAAPISPEWAPLVHSVIL